ncbi:MAG: hypothetical protein WC284_18515 [Candidimonas sp.]
MSLIDAFVDLAKINDYTFMVKSTRLLNLNSDLYDYSYKVESFGLNLVEKDFVHLSALRTHIMHITGIDRPRTGWWVDRAVRSWTVMAKNEQVIIVSDSKLIMVWHGHDWERNYVDVKHFDSIDPPLIEMGRHVRRYADLETDITMRFGND